jgi:hypothetical protein
VVPHRLGWARMQRGIRCSSSAGWRSIMYDGVTRDVALLDATTATPTIQIANALSSKAQHRLVEMNEHDDISVWLSPKVTADVKVCSNKRVEQRRRVEAQSCCIGGHQRRHRCSSSGGGGSTSGSTSSSSRYCDGVCRTPTGAATLMVVHGAAAGLLGAAPTSFCGHDVI